jgi:hypothetical protein
MNLKRIVADGKIGANFITARSRGVAAGRDIIDSIIITGNENIYSKSSFDEAEFDETDMRILTAIYRLSKTSFVNPVKVNEFIGLDEIEFGDRLMFLRSSGHIEVLTGSYAPGMSLQNGIYNIRLKELGRRALMQKK